MRVQTSFTSQPHGRPQACSAQMAPAMSVNVHSTKPTATRRKLMRSNCAEEGSRSESRSRHAAKPVRSAGASSSDLAAEASGAAGPWAVEASAVPPAPTSSVVRVAAAARLARPISARSWTSWTVEKTAPSPRTPTAQVATKTWMISQ